MPPNVLSLLVSPWGDGVVWIISGSSLFRVATAAGGAIGVQERDRCASLELERPNPIAEREL